MTNRHSDLQLAAAMRGESTYKVPTPCTKGHYERITTSGACVECNRQHNERMRQKSEHLRRLLNAAHTAQK